ncbi:MAG: hypothetical protein HY701_13695 [Gemmatimonadetes bacterium]|nr:hypothetical protein [Gemmatimonadota bacterium]
MVAFYVFLVLVLMRVIIVSVGAALLIQPVSHCPACFQPTIAIANRWLRLLTLRFEWRWCPHCRWQGPARRSAPASRAPRPATDAQIQRPTTS